MKGVDIIGKKNISNRNKFNFRILFETVEIFSHLLDVSPIVPILKFMVCETYFMSFLLFQFKCKCYQCQEYGAAFYLR